MSKKHNQKLITPEILRQAVIGSFQKLNPRYMMKNPVMFVVEVGCAITLVLSFFPNVFGDLAQSNLRTYNIIVCVILFITVLFANFAESVAEGRGKAQAASLKKTQKETKARLLKEDGVFLCSGIIDTRGDEVAAALEAAGLHVIRRREKTGWIALEAKQK